MDNRFGFKEFVFAVLLVAVIIVLVTTIVKSDRQWDDVRAIKQQVSQQATDLAAIKRHLDTGGAVTMSSTPGAGTNGSNSAATGNNTPPITRASALGPGDAFDRRREARKAPDFAAGDWLVDAFGANVARVTPLVVTDVYGSIIGSYALESMATRDPKTLEWKPLLAESWKISEDGLTMNFKLRQGVVFSDGKPLTSEDAVFTYQLILNEALDAPRVRNEFTDVVESVTAPGPYEVVFKFKKPYFESFGLAAGMDILPKHFYSKYKVEDINRKPGLLMGTGPYRLESPTDWAPGKLLRLVRNERYWAVPPAFENLVYHEVSNETARLTMFRNSQLDRFGAQPEQYVELLKDEALLAKNHRFEFEQITGGYGFVAWNQKRKGSPTPFADKRVRQAMTMMINSKRVMDDILLGYAIPVTGPFNRLNKQNDPALKPWPYDVARAKALLKEAGYTVGADGTVRSADGKPLKFAVTFPSGTGFWERVLLLLKDSLAEAGVGLDLDPLEWAVFDARIKARDFDALCMAWSGGIESDVRQMFHSSQIEGGADNFTSYSNPELDKLIDKARETVDEAKRMPLWQQCHRILHEDQPYTFLYSRRATILIDKRIKNIEELKIGLSDRTEWYVPVGAQRWTKQ